MVKSTTTQPLPLWKRALEIFVVVFVFLVIAIVGFQLFRILYEQPPEDMLKISDQFTPRRSWNLVTARIEPKRILCVDAECPSVWKEWKTESLLTRDEFVNMIHNAGWNFKVDGSCMISNPTRYGTDIEVCSASGTVNKYFVSLSVTSSNPPASSGVKLNISERN